MKQTFFLGVIVSILLSCTSNNKKSSGNIPPIQKPEKKLSITFVGIVEFVKSYSEIQSLRSEKEIDKFMKERERSNPGFMHESFRKDTIDKFLKIHFENSGFVKGDELLLPKFKYGQNPDTSFTTLSGNIIKLHFDKGTIHTSDIIKVFNGIDSTSIKDRCFYGTIKYAFLDAIPGGNKEVVVLGEHYLMNTDFYDFFVFEIKTKD